MSSRAPEESRDTPRATGDGSSAPAAFWRRLTSAGPSTVALLSLGTVAALLMIAAELTPLFEVQVVTASCEDLAQPDLADLCVTRGGEQHAYGLLLLALVTLLMSLGAGLGRSRPAAAALVAVGVVVLGITLALDLPDSRSTGEIGRDFAEARAVIRPGLWLELAGGVLAVAAGALGLRRRG